MKTSLSITVILISIGINCFSQTFIDTLKQDIKQHSLASTVKKDLGVLKSNGHFVSVYETTYDFEAGTLDCQFTYNRYWYSLVGHFVNDSIISVELTKKIEDSDITFCTSELQFLDTLLATRFLSEHNTFFSSSKDLPDFFLQRFERFGYSCGISGGTPESMIDCLRIIKNKDHNSLISLATSLSPTDRAYGIFGLYILSRLGNKLTERESKLIKLNQTSKAVAYICSARLYGRQPLNELLDKKSLKWYYDWYKRIGKSFIEN